MNASPEKCPTDAARGGARALRCERGALAIPFLRVVGGLLVITSLAEFLSLAANPPVLAARDPLIGEPYRVTLLGCSSSWVWRRFFSDVQRTIRFRHGPCACREILREHLRACFEIVGAVSGGYAVGENPL